MEPPSTSTYNSRTPVFYLVGTLHHKIVLIEGIAYILEIGVPFLQSMVSKLEPLKRPSIILSDWPLCIAVCIRTGRFMISIMPHTSFSVKRIP